MRFRFRIIVIFRNCSSAYVDNFCDIVFYWLTGSYHSASPGVSTPLMDDMMDSHMNFVRAITDFQPNPSNMDMLRLQVLS